jgi:uncharacterized repeat protein (TIGR01451 family)
MTAGARTRLRALLAVTALAALTALTYAPPAFAATFTVTNTADTGAGSLRQAITEANASVGNTIAFAIPGPGPHLIAPASALPGISKDDTTIDGCTQPGADCGVRPLQLVVQLDGQGMQVSGGHRATIRGLSITGAAAAVANNRIAREGSFQMARELTIERNLLGIAPDGSADGNIRAFQLQPGIRGLNSEGLEIIDNVIGSNANTVVDLRAIGFQTPIPFRGLRIEGNIIGLDPTGTQARPNAGEGIVVAWSSGARIVGNTVANGTGAGIRHLGRAQAVPGSDPAVEPGLLIQGNVVEDNSGSGIVLAPNDELVGLNDDPNTGPVRLFGNTIEGNGAAGVSVIAATGTLRPSFQIGGTGLGQPNAITANAGPGVAIGADETDTSVAVTVRGNSIYANTGLPIDLASDGATENGEAGLARSGPNPLVTPPLIEAIEHGSLIVDGTYVGAAATDFTLDFYASESEDGPQSWLGSAPVTTDAEGKATFHAEFESDLEAGWLITATATDANGSTSEFGVPMLVPERPPAPPAPPVSGNPPAAQQPGAQPGQPQQPQRKPQRKRGKPALVVQKVAGASSARPGSVVGYKITIWNKGNGPARAVEVCDEPPAGLTILRTEPAAAGGGSPCWRLKSLAAGGKRVFRLTAQIAADAGRGVERNVATVSAANVKGVRSDSAAVRVKLLPDTACLIGGGSGWLTDVRFLC